MEADLHRGSLNHFLGTEDEEQDGNWRRRKKRTKERDQIPQHPRWRLHKIWQFLDKTQNLGMTHENAETPSALRASLGVGRRGWITTNHKDQSGQQHWPDSPDCVAWHAVSSQRSFSRRSSIPVGGSDVREVDSIRLTAALKADFGSNSWAIIL